MIKLVDGKLVPSLLSYEGVIPDATMKDYNYITMKNDFEKVVDTLSTNLIIHSFYEEILKYDVTEDLQFVVYCKDTRKNKNDMELYTLSREFLDCNLYMCEEMLHKFKDAWNRLSEVEKYIIKCLYFNNEKMTDEEIFTSLSSYKNKFHSLKKSAYIKMDSYLGVNNVVSAKTFNEQFIDAYKLITLTENQTIFEQTKTDRLYDYSDGKKRGKK